MTQAPVGADQAGTPDASEKREDSAGHSPPRIAADQPARLVYITSIR
ncbi:hypothetical protein [Streptomyces bullii]|uniref:Uncharacterized protein n=1 Tax=Streptomyces bullii TaxID=349910 RepID=A0ABW0V482_9ACTN